jgi:hypothetical protein
MPFKEALGRLDNRRVKSTRPLIPPQILQEEAPLYVYPATYLQLDILIVLELFWLLTLSLKVEGPPRQFFRDRMTAF